MIIKCITNFANWKISPFCKRLNHQTKWQFSNSYVQLAECFLGLTENYVKMLADLVSRFDEISWGLIGFHGDSMKEFHEFHGIAFVICPITVGACWVDKVTGSIFPPSSSCCRKISKATCHWLSPSQALMAALQSTCAGVFGCTVLHMEVSWNWGAPKSSKSLDNFNIKTYWTHGFRDRPF